MRTALARLPGATSNEPVERWRRETRRHPDRAAAWSTLAHQLARAGKEDEALDACRQAIAINAGFANPWNLQGVLEARSGRFDEAAVSCRRAVEVDPTFTEAWVNLSTVYDRLGRPADAELAARQAVALGARPVAVPPPTPPGPDGPVTDPAPRPVDEVWSDEA